MSLVWFDLRLVYLWHHAWYMGCFFIAQQLWNVRKSCVFIHFINAFQGVISDSCALKKNCYWRSTCIYLEPRSQSTLEPLFKIMSWFWRDSAIFNQWNVYIFALSFEKRSRRQLTIGHLTLPSIQNGYFSF